MRFVRILIVACCASAPLLAQHHHGGSGVVSPPAIVYRAFVSYTDQSGPQGGSGFSLTDWEYFQRSQTVAGAALTWRGMTSLGALVDDRAGTPSLLQTGGSYRHGYINDLQHPDEVIMEAAADFRVPIGRPGTVSLYVAPVGAPALGPESYLHRPSAQSDPVAPLGHHWQDATHVRYGVVSATLASQRLALEGSIFNARESDTKNRWPDFSHARLDSYSGRLKVDLRPVVVSGWWGYLQQHDPIAPAMRMHQYGASMSLTARGLRGGEWSSLAVWGVNVHHHDGASHLLLHGDPNASPHMRSSSLIAESNLDIGDRHTVFGRVERVFKNGEELGFFGGNLTQLYDIRSVVAGAKWTIARLRFADLAVGGMGSMEMIPAELEPVYGSRYPTGINAYLNLTRAR